MDIFTFAITVILVTASGALAPGPLFVATIIHGSKQGIKSGIIFSITHTIVEFSIIMLFALGLLSITNQPYVKQIIGILGGIVLIIFGIMQIYKSYFSKEKDIFKEEKKSTKNLFFIGLAFSGLNPYFLVWWLTVGAQLIIIALEFASFLGVLFMYACHVWMDYVWLSMVAYFSKKGRNIAGLKMYRYIIIIFGVILIYFGFNFLLPSLGLID